MSLPDPLKFLTVDDVLQVHADTLEREGGMDGLRDSALLESAVMVPQQAFGGRLLHPTLAAMAAAYLFHITSNHPFYDGNKRAGAMAALTFLDANGVEEGPDPVELEAITLRVASGDLSKDELTAWFDHALGET